VDDDPASQAASAAVARAFLRMYVGIDAEGAHALSGPAANGDDHAEVWTWRIGGGSTCSCPASSATT
jgi:hypothetical protein